MKIEELTTPTWQQAHNALAISGYNPEFVAIICDKLRCSYRNATTRKHATIIIDGAMSDDAIDDRPVSVDGVTIIAVSDGGDEDKAYLALS